MDRGESMNAEQREELMFEIRNRIANLEMVVNEVMRIMRMLIEEKELYEKVLDLIEKYEIDEICEGGCDGRSAIITSSKKSCRKL
jgi:hypothetical protein